MYRIRVLVTIRFTGTGTCRGGRGAWVGWGSVQNDVSRGLVAGRRGRVCVCR